MRIALNSFRGEVPRLAPELLPENAAQVAINAMLKSGNLESWKHFALEKTLANPPSGSWQTIYYLNDKWLSWNAQVDVVRGVIPGDTTFMIFLTSPGLYSTPRFTTYALATTGAEPFPVATRALGVPPPSIAPTLAVGIDPAPTSFSTDVSDAGDKLSEQWVTSPTVPFTD